MGSIGLFHLNALSFFQMPALLAWRRYEIKDPLTVFIREL